MFGEKIFENVDLQYLDFTGRILVGSSVLDIDQHCQFNALFDWSRSIWKGLLTDSDLR